MTAPFDISQVCLPYIKAPTKSDAEYHIRERNDTGFCIIYIGSFRAQQSDSNQKGYISTKAGQLGLIHSIAISCQLFEIRINLIASGRIKMERECCKEDEKGKE